MTREPFRGRDPQWAKHEKKHLEHEVRDYDLQNQDKHPEGERGLIAKDARAYVISHAKKTLEEDIFREDSEIPRQIRTTVLDHAIELLGEFCKGSVSDRDQNMYTLLVRELEKRIGYWAQNRPTITGRIAESLTGFIHEYDDLVNLRPRDASFRIHNKEEQALFSVRVLLQPEYRDGVFSVKSMQNVIYPHAFPYRTAPPDPLFFKNVFGIEIGSPYALDYSFSLNTKRDDGSIEYELNIQRERNVLYRGVFSGALQSLDDAYTHHSNISNARIEDVFRQAQHDREEFAETSKANLARGIEYFGESLKRAKQKFVGVRVQHLEEYGSQGKKQHGFFHEGVEELEALLAQYPDTIAWPVYGDDLFSLDNDYVHNLRKDFHLGSNQIAKEESFPDEDRVEYSIFKLFVTQRDYKEFFKAVHEMHEKKFSDTKHILPSDVQKLLSDGKIILRDPETEFSPQRADDMVMREVFDNIHTYDQFVASQDSRAGELGASFKQVQQEQLKNYLRDQNTSILVDVVIKFFFQPNTTYVPLILGVLFERSMGVSGGLEELCKTFQRKVSQDRWIHLRRAIWAEISDQSFLKKTLDDILASGGDGLGEVAGTVSVLDPYKKKRTEENYQWGRGDIIAILDRLSELAKAGEQPISQSEAKNAIKQLLANRHNMNEVIARCIPFIKDSVFFRSVIARWSADSPNPRFRDIPRRIAPFASVPCTILAYGKERMAHSVLGDEAYSYETRLFALSRIKTLRRSELAWAEYLLLQPNVHNHGQSELRTETINRGLLDVYPESLQKIFLLSESTDLNVNKAAQRRLNFL
ncbi:hypothetical protein HY621_01310 [Candidatus Uhrbacteria bacterium]|nr:hypothetical protein [Candidatus Uhrbacteria bacterium]